jgi:putative ABC transport system permease protein
VLLIRLAAQNLGRRRLRTLFLGLAVALAVGVGVASFITGWALRDGIATSFSRMGADLVVVPRGTLVNLTSSLLTVQPTEETLDAAVVRKIAAIEGVARAAPQRLVRVVVEGRNFNLIAFDPATDFTVQNWLREQRQGPLGVTDLLAGGRVPGAPGETLAVCRRPLEIYGRLAKTGVGPFDESYFITFAGLDFLAALCSQDAQLQGLRASAAPDHAAHEAEASQALCMPNFVPGRVTAVLLQLAPAARAEQVKFAIAQLPDLKVVEGNTILTSSRQSLRTLFVGIGAFSMLVALALLILVSLLFSAIVAERSREIGLLRALGATPNQVVTLVLAEAAMVTGLGGLGGLVFGCTLLFASSRSLGYYFETLGVPFGWPAVEVLAAICAAVVLASIALGIAGALYPAWRVRRMEPYALIQGESGR